MRRHDHVQSSPHHANSTQPRPYAFHNTIEQSHTLQLLSPGLIISPSATFPKTIVFRRQLPLIVDDSQKTGVLEVMKGLQLLFGKRGTELSKTTATFAMDTIFVKHTCGIGAFVRPCSVTKSPLFDVKLTLFKTEGSDNAFLPLDPDRPEHRILVPESRQLHSGIQFAAQLMAKVDGHHDGHFSFQRASLADDPIPGPPGALTLSGLEPAIDLERLQEEDRVQRNTCRTLRLLRKAKRPWQHQRVAMAIRLIHKTAVDKKPAAPPPGLGHDAPEDRGHLPGTLH